MSAPQPQSPSLEQLASEISSSVSTLTKFLAESGNPQPSFSADGPLHFPKDAPKDVAVAQLQLITACRKMQFLALWPIDSLLNNLGFIYHDSSSLRWINHFNIPSAVPLEGSISYADLAEKTDLDEGRLTRIIRHAMTNHLFYEPEVGLVGHTAMSALLARDKVWRGAIGHFTEEMFPSAAKLVEATEKYGRGPKGPTETAFNIAFDTELTFMDFICQEKDRGDRMTRCMKAITQVSAVNALHVVKGYDWKALGEATVVDVGGSSGHVSIAIAREAPDLKFVVQDQVEIIANAQAELPSDLASRITYAGHDFFTPNPVHEADVFILRQILHDWPESDAIRILKNLLPAMKPQQTKVLICDIVVLPPGEASYLDDRFVRMYDMQMMVANNAHERTIDEWRALCDAVGLHITNIIEPLGSAQSIIEAVLVAE